MKKRVIIIITLSVLLIMIFTNCATNSQSRVTGSYIIHTQLDWDTVFTEIDRLGNGTITNFKSYILTINGDIQVQEEIFFPSYVEVTLKGSGTVSVIGNNSLFTLQSNRILIINGDVIDGLDKLIIQGNRNSERSIIHVNRNAVLELRNGTITGSGSNWGAVRIGGGTFIMSGGNINGNTSVADDRYANMLFFADRNLYPTIPTTEYGNTIDIAVLSGGIYISDGGTFNMTGGTIAENNASGYYSSGGGISIWNGSFTMSGGSITRNTAAFGGGIAIWNGSITMTGGSISENSGPFGGGLYITRNASFIMNGGNISHNITGWSGGGVLVTDNASFIMNGGIINGNTGREGGSGVAVLGENAIFTKIGGIIFGNDVSDENDLNLSGSVLIVRDNNIFHNYENTFYENDHLSTDNNLP